MYKFREQFNSIEKNVDNMKNQNLKGLKDIVTDFLSQELEEMAQKDAIFEEKLQETINTIYNRIAILEKKYKSVAKTSSESEIAESVPEKKTVTEPPSTPKRQRRISKLKTQSVKDNISETSGVSGVSELTQMQDNN